MHLLILFDFGYFDRGFSVHCRSGVDHRIGRRGKVTVDRIDLFKLPPEIDRLRTQTKLK